MKYQPSTVDEAADCCIAVLNERDKATIRTMKKDELTGRLHFGVGMWIRNNLGLWRGNQGLVAMTGSYHLDDESSVILKAHWRRLQDA